MAGADSLLGLSSKAAFPVNISHDWFIFLYNYRRFSAGLYPLYGRVRPEGGRVSKKIYELVCEHRHPIREAPVFRRVCTSYSAAVLRVGRGGSLGRLKNMREVVCRGEQVDAEAKAICPGIPG